MTEPPPRARRRGFHRPASLALVLCLTGVGLICGAHAARADDTIRAQEYVQVMGLDLLKEEGLDGSGVTIAVVDTPADTSVPELAAADITTTTPCDVGLNRPEHATGTLSLLASPDYGWAPKATFLHYAIPTGGQGREADDAQRALVKEKCGGESTNLAAVVNRALNDGADVINISLGSDLDTITMDTSLPYALVRASKLGVPVVLASGNDSGERVSDEAATNGAVAVGATTLDGTTTDFSNQGPGLTIMAPGVSVVVRDPDGNGALTRIDSNAQGTSFAAPLVTGTLALAMQKWPEATGNQLLRSMLDTAGRAHGVDAWDTNFGWGLVRAVDLVDTDPMSQPDSNPLLQKVPGNRPTPEMIAGYWDGLEDPSRILGDEDYIYRGTSETTVLAHPENSQLGTSPRFHGAGLDVEAYLAGRPQPASSSGSAQSGDSSQSGSSAQSGTTAAQQGGAGDGTSWPLIAGGAAIVLLLGVGGSVALVRTRRSRPQEQE